MACKGRSEVSFVRGVTVELWALKGGRALLFLLGCKGASTGFMDKVDSVVGGRGALQQKGIETKP